MNWYHDKQPETDDVYQKNGMRMVYGNFHPRLFENWFSEISDGAEGFSVSNWSMADKRHMQRNAVLFNIAYGSMMIWNREFDENFNGVCEKIDRIIKERGTIPLTR